LGVVKISKIADYVDVKAKDLVRKLKALGATFEWGGRGSHLHVFLNGKRSIIPMHGSKDLKAGTLRAIKRDLGLKKEI
jgi:mRNA interferase HicA